MLSHDSVTTASTCAQYAVIAPRQSGVDVFSMDPIAGFTVCT